MKINTFQEHALDITAYRQGRQSSIKHDSDPTQCPNPYPLDSQQRESWRLGWNYHWNPQWDSQKTEVTIRELKTWSSD